MKNTLLGCGIVLVCSMMACSSGKEMLRNRTAKNMQIDGDLKEWEMPLERPVSYLDMQCAVANDETTLYITARIADKGIQRRMMTLGMTIWLDTLAKNKHKIGIGYPLALDDEQIEKITIAAQKNNQLDPRALDRAYAELCNEFELVGFVEERIRVSNLASRDMKVATAFDDVGAMICEIKIPLDQLWKQKIDYTQVLSVGLQINEPDKNAADDPGLFDDPNNNSITRSNQQANPMNSGLGGQQQNQRQPTRTVSNTISVWLRTTLVAPSEQ